MAGSIPKGDGLGKRQSDAVPGTGTAPPEHGTTEGSSVPPKRIRFICGGKVIRPLDVSAKGDEKPTVANSFLRRKFDELPGSADEEELVSKWCGFLAKVRGKLSRSGSCKYGLLRQLSNFNLGLINRCELVVVVSDMIGDYPDLVQEFGSLLPPLDHDDGDGEGGSKSDCSSQNGRKRKLIAEADQRKQRKITKDEADDMNYGYILEYGLAEAIRYAFHVLHGTSDTSERSVYKAYYERIVNEMYEDEGPDVLAMTQVDLANKLPAVISRLQQKSREHAKTVLTIV